MKKYTFDNSYNFEVKLVETVKASPVMTQLVIEEECEVSTTISWQRTIEHYPADKLADVLSLSADKGIISSNTNYYILHEDYFECVDSLIDTYGDDLDQAIRDIWNAGKVLFKPFVDTVTSDSWQLFYIGNFPNDVEVKIIDSLVANKKYDLLEELADERDWAIYWN